MTAVHQLIPTLSLRDAIGTHALQVQQVLRDLGFASDLYVDGAPRALRKRVRHYTRLGAPARDAWLLYQCSTGSKLAAFIASRPEPKLVNYHNITPARFYEPWEPLVAGELKDGRRQLASLAPVTELAIAVSHYNEAELIDAGFPKTAVVPVLVDLTTFEHEVDPATRERLEAAKAGGGADLLFVGRLSPNKAQQDLIKALAVYRQVYDPRARLHLVGGVSSHAYFTALQSFARSLGLAGAVDLAGSVSQGALAAYYRAADVLVCLSEHEGFSVPLLEAMHHRVPIVAYASAAVPETLAGAGVLLADKSAPVVAAAIARVMADGALRAQLITAGARRLGDFTLHSARERFAAAVTSVVGAR